MGPYAAINANASSIRLAGAKTTVTAGKNSPVCPIGRSSAINAVATTIEMDPKIRVVGTGGSPPIHGVTPTIGTIGTVTVTPGPPVSG